MFDCIIHCTIHSQSSINISYRDICITDSHNKTDHKDMPIIAYQNLYWISITQPYITPYFISQSINNTNNFYINSYSKKICHPPKQLFYLSTSV